MGEMKKILLQDGRCLVIREACVQDAEKLLAYVKKIAGETDYITFAPEEFHVTLEQEIAKIEEYAQTDNQLILVAEIGEEIVGNLDFRGGKYSRTAHAGEFGLSVLKDYWGLSIGKHLLRYLIDWAKKTGKVRKINLRVRVDNERAIRLYQRLGFVIEGTLKREFYVGGRFIDSYLMGLCVDPK
jgi:RimJ/RimL family protein N-acetyltransferase